MMRASNGVTSSTVLHALDIERIIPGDILLTRIPMSFDEPSTWSSHMIQKVTKSPYSHAALCIDQGLFVEAVGTGVGRLAISQAALRDRANVRVLRLQLPRPQRTSAVARRAAAAAARFLLQGFSRRGLSAGKGSAFQNPVRSAVLWAQLVARAYEDAELALVPDKTADTVVPGDLMASPLLCDVTDSTLLRMPLGTVPDFFLDDASLFERAHHWEAVTKLKILCNHDVKRILDGFGERPASFWEMENVLAERRLRPLDAALYRGLTWYRFSEVYQQKLTAADTNTYTAARLRGLSDTRLAEAVAYASASVRQWENDQQHRTQEFRVYSDYCAQHAAKTFVYLGAIQGRLLELGSQRLQVAQQRWQELDGEAQRRGIAAGAQRRPLFDGLGGAAHRQQRVSA